MSRTSTRLFWFALAGTLFVHLLPRLVLGDRSFVIVHDNLDSDFIYRVLIARPGRLFDYHGTIPELMSGVIPRSVFPPATKLSSLLFWLLPPFWAYVCLEMCVRLLAFCGMHALLRDHLAPSIGAMRLAVVSATFATLPYFVIFDGSVAGQPLVAWAFLNLWHGQRRRASFAALAAFPFVSVLPISGLFVVALAGAALAIAAYVARRVPRDALLGLGALLVGYLASDFWFVCSMLGGSYVSHRSTWRGRGSILLMDSATLWKNAELTFFWGRYHSASLHTVILGLT
jgi:hypothetical protein